MAEKEEVIEKKEEEEGEKTKIWVSPVHSGDCGCSDDEDSVMKLEFSIPGAFKDKIHLHVVEKSMRLVAPKNDTEEYVSHYHFACPADIAGTDADYKDGVLKVTIPYNCPNPYKEVAPIKIN